MKQKNIVSCFALMTAIVAVLPAGAQAGVRIGNRSRTYADAYSQVNAMASPRTSGDETTDTQSNNVSNPAAAAVTPTTTLPVRVMNTALADKIARGDVSAGVGMHDLERCSMVYPSGEFAWDAPTAGIGRGGAQTCVAVVEMRAVAAGPAGEDLVLARANVASGSSAKCNISEFPEYGYTDAAYEYIFPADNPPTMADVEKVMNAEQKQNAGFKIAASALVGAIGGNMVGKNDLGHDSLLGTDKGKIQGSVIGGLAGAAIGAGSAYGGKVGGDVILSTGVNAAAGGIMGNALATGDSVLRIEDCVVGDEKTTCAWGYVMDAKELKSGDGDIYFNINSSGRDETYICSEENDTGNKSNKRKVCKKEQFVNIKLDGFSDKTVSELKEADFNSLRDDSKKQYHLALQSDGAYLMESGPAPAGASGDEAGLYIKVASASRADRQYAAMVVGVKDTTFGMKSSDWTKWKKEHSTATVVARGAKGAAVNTTTKYPLENFYPIYKSADDGSIIDFGNKARLKATLTGAGAGGALGAFSAYQGAKTDISNRWTTAMREYEDSLGKVYCITGDRYLTRYNDVFDILSMPE